MIFNGDGFSVASTDKGLNDQVDLSEQFSFGKDVPRSNGGKPALGMKPKPNRPDPVSDSMVREMKVLGPVKGHRCPPSKHQGHSFKMEALHAHLMRCGPLDILRCL